MKFAVKKVNRNIPNEELLADVKNIASTYGLTTMSQDIYVQYGKFHPTTLIRRFGSWFKVLELCDLKPSRSRINIPNEELFANIEHIWLTLGRQPKYSDIQKPLSLFSVGTYEQRFGSWYNALDAFVIYMSEEESVIKPNVRINKDGIKHTTKREPSARLKVQVLMRDGNRCRLCGVECNDGLHNIHFDHIIPWSKGGETTLENLQVLCSDCNLAKGNCK
ncbi:MAG: HNH endonuclease [Alistipes sp.]|nr:HNH endonuclease [Alistipes sp.]